MNRETSDDIALSVLCAIRNAGAGLSEYHEQLKAALESLGLRYEIIFINDGSDDDSLETLRSLAKLDGTVRYIDLSREFGTEAALLAGFDYAGGRAVVTLDIDNADQVKYLSVLVERWQTGGEVLTATAGASGEAPMRLLDAKAVRALRRIYRMAQAQLRTLDEIIEWIGFRQVALQYPAARPVEAVKRTGGCPLTRRWSAFLSRVSVRTVAFAAAGTAVAALAYGLIAGGIALFGEGTFSVAIFLALALTAVQLTALAAVGQYVASLWIRANRRSGYVVRHAHGFAAEEPTAPHRPASPSAEVSRFTVMT